MQRARRGKIRLDWRRMDNDLVKRLLWSGLLAGLGALASIATQRTATLIWQRVYGEDPPE